MYASSFLGGYAQTDIGYVDGFDVFDGFDELRDIYVIYDSSHYRII